MRGTKARNTCDQSVVPSIRALRVCLTHEVEGDLHALVVVRDENLKAVFLGDQACERKLQLQIDLPIRAQ